MPDREWMHEAIEEAKKALFLHEVPVGAIVVKDGVIVSRAHNRCETDHDPTAHAELIAAKEAFAALGSLDGCTLYVTLEPCAMCAGALVHMRLPRLVFGAFDDACGCCGSRIDLTDRWFDHSIETIGGIMEQECAQLLNEFFRTLRVK